MKFIIRSLIIIIPVLLIGRHYLTHHNLFRSSDFAPSALPKGNSFWRDQQRRGGNFFNTKEIANRFRSARRLGLDWVRLTPSKWKSNLPGSKLGDFLIGPKGNYRGLVLEDLQELRRVLDMAKDADLKVVITFLNLPGRRWSQHNEGVQERLIWESFSEQSKALQFIKDVVTHIKDHPAIAGINPINEPSPERVGYELKDWYTESYSNWYEKIKNTPQDLNLFYKKVVSGIRKIDRSIPIVLDTGFYGTPWAIKIMEPIKDENVFYSFHSYEPFNYAFQKGEYSYPGKIPLGEIEKRQLSKTWNKEKLREFLHPIRDWQKSHGVLSSNIIVGEFGVFRDAPGARKYLEDQVNIFNDYGWHWAFYSFREDNWSKMDYELGTKRPPFHYWKSLESGILPNYDLIKDTTLLESIFDSPEKYPSPPMGWNSWNWFGKEINESLIKASVDSLSNSGLTKAGFEYIVVDGGWRKDDLDSHGKIVVDSDKFPSGLKALGEYVHKAGLKFGVHVVAGTHDCAMNPNGSLGRELQHISQLVEWDVDYIKLDLCVLNNTEDWPEAKIKEAYQAWAVGIEKSTKKIHLNMSTYKYRSWYPQLGNSGRTTLDIKPRIFGGASFDSSFTGEFLSVMEIAELNNKLASKAGRGYWNDPDMMVIGDPGLTIGEQRTHFALWCIMTAPLILGNDVREIDPQLLSVLSNKYAIQINQDPHEQGRRIKQEGSLEYWLKNLRNGEKALLILNRSKKRSHGFSFKSKEIGISRKMHLFDVFAMKVKGTKELFTGRIAPRDSLFLKIKDVH